MTSATQTKPTPSTPERSQRADARRNREAVLVAARKRFAEKGVECGMDEIARTAGVGVGTVYRHFPTKNDLIAALVHDHFSGLAERAAEALEQDDPWDAFCEFLRSSARIQAEDRALSQFLAAAREFGDRIAVETGLADRTEKLIRRAQRAGDLRKDVVVEDVPTLMCGLGAITAAHPDSLAGQNWERFLELALDGMQAPGRHKLPAPRMRIRRS